MDEETKWSDVIMTIQAGYLTNGCDGCPFCGIENYEIPQYCNGVPLYCKWWQLHKIFKFLEREES